MSVSAGTVATGRYARLRRAIQEVIDVTASTPEACVPTRLHEQLFQGLFYRLD